MTASRCDELRRVGDWQVWRQLPRCAPLREMRDQIDRQMEGLAMYSVIHEEMHQ